VLCQEKRIKKFVTNKKFKYCLRGEVLSYLTGLEIMKKWVHFFKFFNRYTRISFYALLSSLLRRSAFLVKGLAVKKYCYLSV